MTNVRDDHLQFEAKKISMVHTRRDGHVLRLGINPADTPEELFRDPVDQRYMVVLVRLAEETDDIIPVNDIGKKAVSLAAVLCKNWDFQKYMFLYKGANNTSEEEAAMTLKAILQINSRSELKDNELAREKLFSLRDEFEAAVKAK